LLSEIEQYNSDRKDLDKQTKETITNWSKRRKDFTSVVYQENWHKGVIGIVAPA
jgi:single-stranded-DNA-specific exonuclease